jgi:hypothetical protein
MVRLSYEVQGPTLDAGPLKEPRISLSRFEEFGPLGRAEAVATIDGLPRGARGRFAVVRP